MVEVQAEIQAQVQSQAQVLDEAERVLEELKTYLFGLIAEASDLAEVFDGYSLEVTWVLNKVKKRYYYWYLKSKTRIPRSIYLGSMDISQAYWEHKKLKELKRHAEKSLKLVNELMKRLKLIKEIEEIVVRLKTVSRNKLSDVAQRR